MSRACWRTMACLFAASLGGLAVCADEVTTQTTPPPPAPAFRIPPAVAKAENPPTPVPVGHPRPAESPPAPNPPTPIPESPPAIPTATPEPIAPPTPPPTPMPSPPPVLTIEPPPAVAPATLTVPAPPPPPPLATGVPATPPPPVSPFPWKVTLEVVNGLTQIDLRHGDESLMKVQCEKIDLRMPAGGMQATGRVAVTGPCVEARCDRLTIAWTTGQVALEGGVRLAFQTKGVVHEMRAESVCFRLNSANQPVDFSAGDVRRVAASGQ